MTWVLYELSRHQDYQGRVREEIALLRTRLSQRQQTEVTAADLESMHHLNALIKVRLRDFSFNGTSNFKLYVRKHSGFIQLPRDSYVKCAKIWLFLWQRLLEPLMVKRSRVFLLDAVNKSS